MNILKPFHYGNKFFRFINLLLILFILAMTFGSFQSEAAGKINVTLNKTSYSYTGKAIKPKVTVKYNGKKLSSKSYTLKYSAGRTKVGKYSVKITLKGSYKGTKTVYFYIHPKKPTITSVSPGTNSISLAWKKIANEVSGYQICYSDSSTFEGSKAYYTKDESTTIYKLKESTKYFIKIRSYKTVKGVKYYSSWSAVKKVSTKTADTVKTYHFRNENLLNQHFEKHGREMGFSTAQEYEAAASAVITNPNSLHKTEKEDGDDCYYLEKTNDFVVVSTDGYIRTYFRPDRGKEYFDKQ
ncbi:MAG: fibronectin type III domain-containing protein [Eubacterium sp.]|nr:fibronectin type III domain-containing protein [Eubacterium sp.]